MSGIGALADKLNRYASAPPRVRARVRETIDALITAQFRAGIDAYGRRWKPLKDGRASHLYRTGKLFGTLKVQLEGDQLNLSIDFPAHVLQAQRPIFTIGVMPPAWVQAIERAFAEEMSRI